MKPTHLIRALGLGLAGVTWTTALALPSPANACGGFFCSQSAPVNQAAERIIFAQDQGGSVTAVIQIMYEGPAESFSWLLPISSVPEEGDIGIASDIAFQRLQTATNPQYTLTTRVEGQCRQDGTTGSATGGGVTGGTGLGAPSADGGEGGGVTVEASGVVGQFEWTVISFNESLEDPADAATEWLEANDYDVSDGAPGLIRPYLEDGLNLLALKLVKGADSGSIRPISLTYPAELPMIPIKLTAVAANDDMGVMTWVLSDARAVPKNYLSLELNEARINWFNAGSNYGEVVNAAADEAGGQGFVTEYADDASTLADSVWTPSDESNWQAFNEGVYRSFEDLFWDAFSRYGQFDGFWDVIRQTVTLPDGVAFADFRTCPDCYAAEVSFSPTELKDALNKDVLDPIRDVQALIDRYGYVTRLYTTMSAAEMTVDPLFTFNPDLEDVSNLHTAERIIECNPEVYQWEAPWRIELPQGGVVRGTADQVGTWPTAFDAQPANFRIKRLSESGEGRVYEDLSEDIDAMLRDYNESLDLPEATGGGGDGGANTGTNGSSTGSDSNGGSSSGDGGADDDGDDDADDDDGEGDEDAPKAGGGGGCSASGAPGPATGWGLLCAGSLMALFAWRRRRFTR